MEFWEDLVIYGDAVMHVGNVDGGAHPVKLTPALSEVGACTEWSWLLAKNQVKLIRPLWNPCRPYILKSSYVAGMAILAKKKIAKNLA